jgi:hypothetical protein
MFFVANESTVHACSQQCSFRPVFLLVFFLTLGNTSEMIARAGLGTTSESAYMGRDT